ncbi:MAG: hypothetical protein HXY23_14315 [Parvularculaceae bacterium]|nr:hypothetical protein [Parvularculaceae bacterium]
MTINQARSTPLRPKDRSLSVEAQACGDDGVDLTLIRWMLSLSPAERLQVLQDAVQSSMRLRDARPLT